MAFLGAALGAALIAGCGQPAAQSSGRFAETGELIAMSGGGAGASYACFTCHGLDGLGDGAGSPRLAGIDAGYLERQLQAYADGRRRNAAMEWVAENLDPVEMKRVSSYYQKLPYQPAPAAAGPVPLLYLSGDPSRNLPACASCHGLRGQGIGQANPPLGGQPAAYMVHQIEEWRRGRRRNDPLNVMLEISQKLTPEEAKRLSAFASDLPGGPPSPEPREASP